MSDEIQQIKDRIEIVDLVSEHVPLKKMGRNFRALCPFHAEKTPSFYVSPERQIWHCFGCNTGGDIFTFLMKREGLEFGEALRILAQRAGVKLMPRQSPERQERKERLLDVTSLAGRFFQHLLIKHPLGRRGQEYLAKRGIKPETSLEFGLGYAPNSWESTGKFLLSRKFNLSDLLETGLAISKESDSKKAQVQDRRGWYDRFRGRLIFPIYDPFGRPVGFSARALDSSEPKYINSSDSPIFHKGRLLYGLHLVKDEIRKKNSVILVEGNLDVISCHQAGFKNVVAPLGSALTEEHLKTIKHFTQNVIFAFDQDEGGQNATLRGIGLSLSLGFEVKVAVWADAKDPDELVQKYPKLFAEAVEKSQPFLDYLLYIAKQKFNLDQVAGKRQAANLILPFIAAVSTEIQKDTLVKKIAKELGVEEKSVWQDLERLDRARTSMGREPAVAEAVVTSSTNRAKPRSQLLAEHFLGLLLSVPETLIGNGSLKDLVFQITSEYFTSEEAFSIFSLVAEKLSLDQKPEVKEIAAKLEVRALSLFDEILLKDCEVFTVDEKYLKELKAVSAELQKLFLQRKIQGLSLELKKAENLDDISEVERLKKELTRLTQVLNGRAKI